MRVHDDPLTLEYLLQTSCCKEYALTTLMLRTPSNAICVPCIALSSPCKKRSRQTVAKRH
jgi:hypothetical protein